MVSGDLAPIRVLLVEDEPLVAMMLTDMIAEIGATLAAPFERLAPALDFARDQRAAFDVAIVDMNLAGERAEPLADLLHAAGCPFILSTGYGAADKARWPNAPVLPKPFDIAQLETAIGQAMAGQEV